MHGRGDRAPDPIGGLRCRVRCTTDAPNDRTHRRAIRGADDTRRACETGRKLTHRRKRWRSGSYAARNAPALEGANGRSEERRVGKECGEGGERDEGKKKGAQAAAADAG